MVMPVYLTGVSSLSALSQFTRQHEDKCDGLSSVMS